VAHPHLPQLLRGGAAALSTASSGSADAKAQSVNVRLRSTPVLRCLDEFAADRVADQRSVLAEWAAELPVLVVERVIRFEAADQVRDLVEPEVGGSRGERGDRLRGAGVQRLGGTVGHRAVVEPHQVGQMRQTDRTLDAASHGGTSMARSTIASTRSRSRYSPRPSVSCRRSRNSVLAQEPWARPRSAADLRLCNDHL
jgi:hypothetical protein